MKIQQIPYFLGPLLFILSLAIPFDGFAMEEKAMIGILLWMLTWWITEIVNLAVTALLPMLLMPLMGILSIGEVTAKYGDKLIFLFFGGFVLALAIEKWNLHRRIAILIIRKVGATPKRVLLGFMLATAFISAWISNTATTVMMLPMALSVLQLLKKAGFESRKLDVAVLLGVAWAANIGGMSTLIGTPPNAVFVGFYGERFGESIGFQEWMQIGLPVAAALFIAAFLVLSLLLRKTKSDIDSIKSYFNEEYQRLGKLKGAEFRVAVVFASTALLWILRKQIIDITGLTGLSDTSIAILSAVSLFVIPGVKSEPLLVWKDTRKLAWGILLLFGGGLALASGMIESGLLDRLATSFQGDISFTLLGWIFIMAVLGIWATEVMSNMALVTAMMPVVAAIAAAADQNFILFAIPLTLGSSCAFMLPMATPPNAIVFSSGKLKIVDMAKRGVLMNVIATLLITLLSYALGSLLL
ncbi:MAG: DASS family sodium-coupled anion symporter [Flavobacteriia bacterium]|nr:DASS family sodium-coupled anion symporter [Flavobacteriia bacterium]